MKRADLEKLFASHGGLASIHTVPVTGGWANVAVCADGFKRRLSRTDEVELSKDARD